MTGRGADPWVVTSLAVRRVQILSGGGGKVGGYRGQIGRWLGIRPLGNLCKRHCQWVAVLTVGRYTGKGKQKAAPLTLLTQQALRASCKCVQIDSVCHFLCQKAWGGTGGVGMVSCCGASGQESRPPISWVFTHRRGGLEPGECIYHLSAKCAACCAGTGLGMDRSREATTAIKTRGVASPGKPVLPWQTRTPS